MYQQLGNEVERKRRRASLGGIRTHDTLQFRRALYQLSYQGNSAGRGSNLLHNTIQHKANLKPHVVEIAIK